jgi:hypothetical protein
MSVWSGDGWVTSAPTIITGRFKHGGLTIKYGDLETFTPNPVALAYRTLLNNTGID